MVDTSYVDNQIEKYKENLTQFISDKLRDKLYMANE